MKRKIIYALLAIAASFALWLYVITTISPEYEDTFAEIRVELKNDTPLHDRNLMVISDKTPTVTLKLKGNRSDLSKLSSSNIKIEVDLSKIYEVGEQEVSYSIRYPDNMPNNTFEILSQDPGVIKLNIVERKSVTVPVEEVYSGKVMDGYMTDKENIVLGAETVTITGPASVVDKIARARVQVDLSGKSESISQDYPLTFVDALGNPVEINDYVVPSTEQVHVALKIEYFKVITLIPNVIAGGGANAANTKVTLSFDTITVSGSKQLLDQIDSWPVDIDLGAIEQDAKDMPYAIKLTEGLTNRSGSTVLVTVDIPELKTKELTVTNIVAQNVPAGMKADIMVKDLAVTFRGVGSQIELLTAEHVVAVVDLSGKLEAETTTVKVKIVIADSQFSGVGELGVYDVTVTLTEIAGA